MVRHPWEEEDDKDSVHKTGERHDGPDYWRIEPETAECDGRGEEYGLQSAKSYVDQRKDTVVRAGDDHISREKVAQ